MKKKKKKKRETVSGCKCHNYYNKKSRSTCIERITVWKRAPWSGKGLTPWSFKPLPGLFCLNIFIGCAQKKGWYNKPRIFSLPVSPYFQSLQLPPTWDGRRWVKRFGPGDPHTPAALLSALQVSPLTPNFQTSYYFLPTRWYRWLLGLFLRFRLSPAVFLRLIGPGT